ncbi:MAG: FtsW/RodA/SpoVE family cell cycle protein, partial [Clostridia bacterium]
MTELSTKSPTNILKINNKLLVFSAIILSLLGLLFQYSASSYSALRETGDAFFYVKKQSLSLVIALVCFAMTKVINTDILKKAKWYILAVSVILLAIIFIPHVGVEKYGAKRWMNLGFGTVQPSEIAKFGLVIFIAAELSNKSAVTFGNMFKILLATACVCALVLIEPNMSITMCIGLVVLVMLFVGGTKFRHFFAICAPAACGVVLLILLEPYRLKRLSAFLNPWASPLGEGYQLIQSFYALGS